MVSSPAPAIGGIATYTVAVTNLGPRDAGSTTITDLLPAGLTYVSHTASTGIYDPVSGEWAIAAIPVTGTVMLSIDALRDRDDLACQHREPDREYTSRSESAQRRLVGDHRAGPDLGSADH